MFLSKIHSSSGVGNLLLIVHQFMISNYSVCRQHMHICTSQGQSTFCVHCNKSDLQNVELLCAIGNCFACQVRHACRGLPTPAPVFTSPSWLHVRLSKHILDYRKKQTGTLRISENITFTNDDVMDYVTGALQ